MSIINPKGYGSPIVGLFNVKGELIVYAGFEDSVDTEKAFVTSHCVIEDDEEEGINANITIESTSQAFVDSPVFSYGNRLAIRLGYIGDTDLLFGSPYILYVQNKSIDYSENISLKVELVDEKTFTSKEKPKHDQIIDDAQAAVMGTDKNKVDAGEFSYLSEKLKFEEVFLHLDAIRNNLNERSGLYMYEIKTRYGIHRFYTLWDLRKWATEYDSATQGLVAEIHQIKNLTDHQLIEKYQIRRRGVGQRMRFYINDGLKRTWGALTVPFRSLEDSYPFEEQRKFLADRSFGIGRLTDSAKSVVDLYGLSLTSSGNQQWSNVLKHWGVEDAILDMYGTYSRMFYDEKRNLRKDGVDKLIERLTDEWVMRRVQADMNKSGFTNIEEYLRVKADGFSLINDKGDGEGVGIEQRDLDAEPYMYLYYKGGSGDLLNVTVETNYDEPEVTEDNTVTVDPETGDVIEVKNVGYNQTDGVRKGSVQSYVNKLLKAMQEGRPIPSKEKYSFYDVGPHGFQPGKMPAYLKESGFYTSGIDRFAVDSWIPNTRFYCKPFTVEQIVSELDARRGDVNLKRIIANAEILGNPNIRSGQIFYIGNLGQRFSGRYYAIAVTHDISPNGGYIVKVELGLIPEKVDVKVITKKEDKSDKKIRRYVYHRGQVLDVKQIPEKELNYEHVPVGVLGNKVIMGEHVFDSWWDPSTGIRVPIIEDSTIPEDRVRQQREELLREQSRNEYLKEWGIDASDPASFFYDPRPWEIRKKGKEEKERNPEIEDEDEQPI